MKESKDGGSTSTSLIVDASSIPLPGAPLDVPAASQHQDEQSKTAAHQLSPPSHISSNQVPDPSTPLQTTVAESLADKEKDPSSATASPQDSQEKKRYVQLNCHLHSVLSCSYYI